MIALDARRDVIIPGDKEATLRFSAEHIVTVLNQGIARNGRASIALSGGSTPKAIYQLLTGPEFKSKVDWKNVDLFWSDERSVPPNDPESNYKMAMDAGFSKIGIPQDNIHRMVAEENAEENARAYENLIKNTQIDLVMLGMGDDGHTASLFPFTHALKVEDHLVVNNYVPQLHTWRMTFSYPGIHHSQHICFYVIGKSKAEKVKEVLTGPYEPDRLPSQAVGLERVKALWILDQDSASFLEI